MQKVRFFCFFTLLLQALCGCGQTADSLFQPRVDTVLIPLGADTVPVHKSFYGGAPAPFFVHLHHNEGTADSAAQYFLQREGGVLLSLQNGRQRLVQFQAAGTCYRFDPNRMFTPGGAEKSIRLLGPFAPAALAEVLLFKNFFLSLLPDSLPVITVHNNTNKAYSLRSYLPGGSLAAEAAAVFLNAEMDEDNFVLTTDEGLFEALRSVGISAVLQNNELAADDGSLGFVLGKMGRSYTNIEAEHGHLEEQLRMIETVTAHFNTQKAGM